MTNTYLILTKAKWESALPAKLKKADRLSWNEYTYRDEERSATRNVNVDLPTDDNLKSEITAFMDTHSIDYSSGDTKSELLEKVNDLTTSNIKMSSLEKDMFNLQICFGYSLQFLF